MIAIIALTNNGANLAERINGFLNESEIFLNKRISCNFSFRHSKFDKISKFLILNWSKFDVFVFIMATGIVVRSISSLLIDKSIDPAIIVIDEKGTNVISLLSGHLGGANYLTKNIANQLSANPVITTASDVNNIPAFDELAMKNNFSIKNKERLYKIAVDMLEGNEIKLFSSIDINFEFPKNVVILDSIENDNVDIIITENSVGEDKALQIVPKNIIVGIGCKKNTSYEIIYNMVNTAISMADILPESLIKIATIPLKAHEEGILKLAEMMNLEIEIISIETIAKCEQKFIGSDFVKSVTGVKAVAEPSAFLSAIEPEIILSKLAENGVTVALVKDNSIKLEKIC